MKKYKVFEEVKPAIIHAGTDENPYYTNSSQLPVNFSRDAFEVLDLQDDLQKKYTGGCLNGDCYIYIMAGAKDDRGHNSWNHIKIKDFVEWYEKEKDLYDFFTYSYDSEHNRVIDDIILDAMKIDVSKHDKIRVISGDDINLVTSDWHPFFVKSGDKFVEKRADELKVGDILCGFDTKQLEIKGDWKVLEYPVTKISKIDVDDEIFYDLTTKKYHNYISGSQISENGTMKCVFVHNTVLHLYMQERISSPEACRQLIKTVLTNYRLPYISISPIFSICPKHGYLRGEHNFCPMCDRELMNKHADEIDFTKE